MKSSLGKLGRKLSLQKSDVKEVRDHQPSAHIDELAQASKVGFVLLDAFYLSLLILNPLMCAYFL